MRRLAATCVVTLVALSGCAFGDADGDADGDGDKPTYVAMGDSYSAAPGVPETVDVGCGRSSANYPRLVAEELGLTLIDVTCSGASTTSLIGAQETTTGVVPAQFAALSKDTEYVTMGIGGNDQDFLWTLFTTCLELPDTDPEATPCRDAMNAGGTDVLLGSIEIIRNRVTSALVGTRDRAPDARIVLVGYPQLVPEEGQCDLLPLTAGDADYVRGLMTALGEATEAAAAEAEVGYADVLAASEGHDVCAGEDAWVNGLNGPIDGAAGMHPFAEEQEAVAELVVDALAD